MTAQSSMTTTRVGANSGTLPRVKKTRRIAWIYILVLALSGFFLGPFVWLVLAALKTPAEWNAVPIQIFPDPPAWDNFARALTDANFVGYAINSMIISLTYSVLITVSSAAVGFGFARLKAPGKRLLYVIVLSTMMLPQILTLLPTYMMFSRIGLNNTYWPWVLWGLAGSPYLVFMFRQFFSTLPRDLEDAALIDGAGWGRIFATIFLPLARPMLITSFLLSFTWTWSDYITPVLFLDLDRTTLSVAIAALYTDPVGYTIPTIQAAAAIMYVLPVLMIFFFAQRYFVRSSVGSGIKG